MIYLLTKISNFGNIHNYICTFNHVQQTQNHFLFVSMKFCSRSNAIYFKIAIKTRNTVFFYFSSRIRFNQWENFTASSQLKRVGLAKIPPANDANVLAATKKLKSYSCKRNQIHFISKYPPWLEGPGSRLAWWKLPCTLMAPSACKIRRDAMSSKLKSKLHLWGYQSRGVILSGVDQNCDGMSPRHPLGWIPEHRQ